MHIRLCSEKTAMARLNNFNTFRSRFLLIYGSAAFICILMIASAGVVIYNITNTYSTLSTIIEPLKFNLLTFNSEANQLAVHQQAYMSSGSTESKEQVAYVHKRLKERIIVLASYADTLKDASLQLGVDDLSLQLSIMLEASKQLESSSSEEQGKIAQNKLLPAVAKATKKTKEMNTYLFERHLSSFTGMMNWIESMQLFALLSFVCLMIGFYYILHKSQHFILSQLQKLDQEIGALAKGNLPEQLEDPVNELSSISNSINLLVKNLGSVKEFSEHVGKGDFESDITVFENKGELGNALAGMRQSLKDVSAEDRKRDWVNQGLAKFLSIIRDNSGKTEELSFQVLSNLVKYVNANQGGIFIVEQESGETLLRLDASFAYDRKKFQQKLLSPGQGLVGQAYLERDKIYLKQVPAQYVQITSGLGEATPRTIFIQPLMVNDEVMGILELASFHDFEPYVQDFIQKVSESVAAAIGSGQNSLRNNQILKQSQELAEQLRSQEEELRQNTEELQATQEEMERRIRELEKENLSLRSGIDA